MSVEQELRTKLEKIESNIENLEFQLNPLYKAQDEIKELLEREK